jgi:hypothetical protein
MADKKSNRTLIIVGSSFGVLLLGFAIYLAVLLLAAPAANNASSGESNSSDKPVSISEVPDIVSFEVARDTDTSTTATVTAVLTDGDYQAQYEVLDIDKKTIIRGNVPADRKLTESVEIVNGNNSFTFRVRVENSGAYSNYVSSEPASLVVQNLSVDAGINVNAEPNSEYFNTPWSQGVGGPENLSAAVSAAWGATPVTMDFYCMPLNDAAISPGELIPPLPSTTPETVDLKFDIGPALNDELQLYYYWCEQEAY